MTDLNFSGKRVVVTGAATGVGAALLDVLAELGAPDVTVLDVKEPTGPHATYLRTDLSDPAAVDAAVAQIEGPVDAVFNNAGVADTLPPETVFRVNVLAPLRAHRGAPSADPRRRHGRRHRVDRRVELAPAPGADPRAARARRLGRPVRVVRRP